MARPLIVLLDLEQTLIDDWSTKNFLDVNAVKIRQSGFIASAAKVGLMSWAIHDWKDVNDARQHLIPALEEYFSFRIDPWLPLSMMQWADDVLCYRKLHLDHEDILDMFQKPEILLSVARFHPRFMGHDVVLIDDAFEHGMRFEVPSTDTVVRIVNINAPIEAW